MSATTAVELTEESPQTPSCAMSRTGNVVWRMLEVLASAMALLLLMPMMLILAVAIRLDSDGPVLFRQKRLGRSQSTFTVYKFRTMRHGAGDDVHRAFVRGLIAGEEPSIVEGKPRFKLTGDPRVTRVGSLLRRTSLDELPQLWNVLRGQMSLVGPRPSIAYEVEHYPPPWLERFAVKPGLTGLWQVSGRSELTMQDMVALDIDYVHRRSVRLNIWILIRTVPAVLSLRGAS